MRKTLTLILIFSLIGAAYASNEDEQRFSEAYKAYKLGNHKKAFNLYQKLAEKEIVGAQINIAAMYVHGHGTLKDNSKALMWFKKAAENGSAMAAKQIGSSYQFAYFTNINDEKSFKWYRKAALLGDPIAQEWIGNMYEDGDGTEKNYEKAIHWYEMSASQNYHEGMSSLARILAVCPNKKLRNGKLAIYWAIKALQSRKSVIAGSYDTLALAYAEICDYKQAIKHQLTAIELFKKGQYLKNNNEENNLEKYTEQLELFKKHECLNFKIK